MKTKNEKLTSRIFIRITPFLHGVIRQEAEKIGVSETEMIRFLLRNVFSLDRYSSKDKLIEDMRESEKKEFEIMRRSRNPLNCSGAREN